MKLKKAYKTHTLEGFFGSFWNPQSEIICFRRQPQILFEKRTHIEIYKERNRENWDLDFVGVEEWLIEVYNFQKF